MINNTNVEKRTPLPIEEAIKKVIFRAQIGLSETIPLLEAEDRYLAQNIIADHPVPLFDRSPYDGFAIKAEESEQASYDQPVTLEVIEAIGAGTVARQTVGEKQALRIMTGAPIPEGANAVVMLELTEGFTHNGRPMIRINRPFKPGDNISYQGEEVQAGDKLIAKGTCITAGELAVLATFGYHQVSVYQRPRVGIYATGSELVEVDEPVVPGKIRNSNAYMLHSQIKKAGGAPHYYGILADRYEQSLEAVKKALDDVDFLITTGGVSVGDFDYVPAILKALDAEVLFNKVAMRPGSVTTVATRKHPKDGRLQWIFGLSGNPAACYVGGELFVRPVLQTAVGSPQPHLKRSLALLEHDILKPNPFIKLMRGKAKLVGERCYVKQIGMDKSSVVSSLVDANVLIFLPAQTRLSRGDAVEVLWLDEGYAYV
jgi:molybdopterin molybdotransferase